VPLTGGAGLTAGSVTPVGVLPACKGTVTRKTLIACCCCGLPDRARPARQRAGAGAPDQDSHRLHADSDVMAGWRNPGDIEFVYTGGAPYWSLKPEARAPGPNHAARRHRSRERRSRCRSRAGTTPPCGFSEATAPAAATTWCTTATSATARSRLTSTTPTSCSTSRGSGTSTRRRTPSTTSRASPRT
jgi:hypothetical protein